MSAADVAAVMFRIADLTDEPDDLEELLALWQHPSSAVREYARDKFCEVIADHLGDIRDDLPPGAEIVARRGVEQLGLEIEQAERERRIDGWR